MSTARAAQPPLQLNRYYFSREVKGGTVIAEDVLDLDAHRRRLRHPDDYRLYVGACRCCGEPRVHAHCFRQRSLRSGGSEPVLRTTIRLYRCASPSCGAVFTVLPAFIARHLWRDWETVEAVVEGKKPAPRTTRRRWLHRLASDAFVLFQTFTSRIVGGVCDLLCERQPRNRQEFLDVMEAIVGAPRLALAAAWVHRLEPGLRVM